MNLKSSQAAFKLSPRRPLPKTTSDTRGKAAEVTPSPSEYTTPRPHAFGPPRNPILSFSGFRHIPDNDSDSSPESSPIRPKAQRPSSSHPVPFSFTLPAEVRPPTRAEEPTPRPTHPRGFDDTDSEDEMDPVLPSFGVLSVSLEAKFVKAIRPNQTKEQPNDLNISQNKSKKPKF